MGQQRLKINVGSGDCPTPADSGWIDVDIAPETKPDVIGSVLELPFDDGSAERIYCGHVLEHVAPWKLAAASRELHRVLADDGELMIVGPDILKAVERGTPFADVLGIIRGGRRWPGDMHEWVATGELTQRALHASGLWTTHEIPLSDLMGTVWPVVAFADWQFAVEALKR